MSLNRYAKRRDEIEREIVDALEKAGCRVIYSTNPDLWVLIRGHCIPVEVKSKHGRLTNCQRALIAEGWPLKVVHSIEEALRAVKLL